MLVATELAPAATRDAGRAAKAGGDQFGYAAAIAATLAGPAAVSCLVDSLTGTSLRPGALEVLARLREAGAIVLLWSVGGRDHAISRAAELRFAHLIDAVYAKERRGADGRWGTVHLPPEHQPNVFVDDWPDERPPRPGW